MPSAPRRLSTAPAQARYFDDVSETPDTYVHGHHDSVLRSHTWRTVENSAAYLVPHLAVGQKILDVGCGPGTISVDLARRVAPGLVTAIDADHGVVQKATDLLEQSGLSNCEFTTGDVYALSYPDDTFDIVHAHQVLQHLTNPVAALSEMRRVTKPGGVVAVRDAIYASMAWSPADASLDRWMELYQQMTALNDVNANAGQELYGWAVRVGFSTVTATSSTWTFATAETRAWWGSLWSERVRQSSFAEQALQHGLADETELQTVAAAFAKWGARDDGFFMVPHGEVTAVK